MEPGKITEANKIHSTLAHSYSSYFLLLIAGVLLDLIFHIRIFHSSIMMPIGFALLIIATLIILWAQISYEDLRGKDVTKQHFCKGPYCYTRNPTHLGLFLLILGFGFVLNAFFVILFTVLSLVFTKVVFLKKHDSVMEDKFGAPYREYKKSVKF